MTEPRQRRVGAYAKLLANYASDDAIIDAGEKAELLFIRGLAFLATSDSDGYITDSQLVRFVGAGMRDAAARARNLARVGLWERLDGGYLCRSWTKIHETADEKGRKRKADRERKRLQAESDWTPDGTPPEGSSESLLGTYVSSLPKTEQSRAQQSSAVQGSDLVAPPPHPTHAPVTVDEADATAQTIVAEWIDHAPKRPPGQVLGQASRSIKQMLTEGIDPDDIRRGLAAWMTKGLHPSALPSVVNEVMNSSPRTAPRKRNTDDKVRDGLELAQRLLSEHQPRGLRAIGGNTP